MLRDSTIALLIALMKAITEKMVAILPEMLVEDGTPIVSTAHYYNLVTSA